MRQEPEAKKSSGKLGSTDAPPGRVHLRIRAQPGLVGFSDHPLAVCLSHTAPLIRLLVHPTCQRFRALSRVQVAFLAVMRAVLPQRSRAAAGNCPRRNTFNGLGFPRALKSGLCLNSHPLFAIFLRFDRDQLVDFVAECKKMDIVPVDEGYIVSRLQESELESITFEQFQDWSQGEGANMRNNHAQGPTQIPHPGPPKQRQRSTIIPSISPLLFLSPAPPCWFLFIEPRSSSFPRVSPLEHSPPSNRCRSRICGRHTKGYQRSIRQLITGPHEV